MYEKNDKGKARGFFLISVMLFLFCVLKVIRGTNTSVTTEGGVWNYISLLYYVIAAYGIVKQRVFKVNAIFVLPLIYCVFSMSFAFASGSVALNRSDIYNFLMIPYFFLVFISFYLYSSENHKSKKIILCTYLVCLAVNAYTTIAFLFLGHTRAMANDVYYSLCLMPFALLFVKNKHLKLSIVVSQLFVSFLSNKRAGFIALCLGLVLYYLIEANNANRNNVQRVLRRIILILITIFIFYRVSYYIDTTLGYGLYNRLFRIIADDGSGRGTIYIAVWNAVWSSSWFHILFGHGMNTAGMVVGAGHAHNDFLEILYNYGIIALVCIVGYYVSIVYQAILMIRRKSPYAPAFMFSIVTGVSLSMFSYFLIFFTFVTCNVAFWGYVIKMEKNRLQNDNVIITR